MADLDAFNDDVPGPDGIDKQKLVNDTALAIARLESGIEFTIRQGAKFIEQYYRFRKGGDIHVQEGGKCILEKYGEAMHYLGLAASCARVVHDDLTRIQEFPDYKLPRPVRGGGVTPLGNGGGKNHSKKKPAKKKPTRRKPAKKKTAR